MASLVAFAFWVLVLVLRATIAALPVMLLWNYVVVDIFGFKEIDFFHAWALWVLCTLIFKTNLPVKQG